MADNSATSQIEFVSLIADLGFSSKVRAVAAAHGRSYTNVRTTQSFVGVVGPTTVGGVVDLAHPESLEILKWVRDRGEGPIAILAFYPHVDRSLGDSARDFPFVQVTTRSKFEGALLEFICGTHQKN